jgi:hypothetical protein
MRISLPMEWQGLLFLLAVLAAGMLCRPKWSDSTLRIIFLGANLLLVGGCGALAVADFQLFLRLGAKENVFDWASTAFLLAAAGVAFLAAARLHRRGRSSPTAITLAAGLAWAFVRETGYGRDFLGDKLWYTRNILRPQAWISLTYYEQFRREMHVACDARTLLLVHVCVTPLVLAGVAAFAWYIFRRRAKMVGELRGVLHTLYGRLFIAGAGLYVTAVLAGGRLHQMSGWGWFDAWSPYERLLFHTAVEETVEFWGALTLLFSAAALWQSARRIDLPPGD